MPGNACRDFLRLVYFAISGMANDAVIRSAVKFLVILEYQLIFLSLIHSRSSSLAHQVSLINSHSSTLAHQL